jgi:hypothetical protein
LDAVSKETQFQFFCESYRAIQILWMYSCARECAQSAPGDRAGAGFEIGPPEIFPYPKNYRSVNDWDEAAAAGRRLSPLRSLG